ncbi:MAG: 30S ribosomal protein S4e [Hadesarchaea archaeon]|nr:30S ribosomal protein S4e [Hadesarchaea archaeon]
MSKKGQRKHQKRLSVTGALKLPRKTEPWVVNPTSGPHSKESCIPLSVLLRDYLELARTAREANTILGNGDVKVDGVVRKDPRFPVGFMDIIQINKSENNWRVIYDEKGYLALNEIPDEEAEFKLAKIEGKQPFKGGKTQLAFHEGRTKIGDFQDFKVGDVVKLSLPEFEIEDHLPKEEGKIALITGGSNVGKVGKILEINKREGTSKELISLEGKEENYQAPENYVFIIGEEESLISIRGE